MKEIQLTKGQIALVDDEDFEWLNQRKWWAKRHRNTFYAHCRMIETGKIVLMHRLILDLTDPKIQTDHKDRNGLNNQKYNLRVATNSQNTANRKSFKNSTSKYLGVRLHKRDNIWEANIQKDGKLMYIGRFKTEEDAALAYNKVAQKLHGEFANLNII